MELLIIGTGYVGLVTGACFAEMGYRVTCLDVNKEKINLLQAGIIPIYEPGLEEIVRRNTQAKRLTFTTEYQAAVAQAKICILAVDTPVSDSGAADLRSITKAATSIGEHLNDYKIIVNKSTVPVGTAAYVRKVIQAALDKRESALAFDVVSNPEFLKEGSAIADFMRPDRVIIGAESKQAETIMQDLYKPFMLSCERLYFMDIASAELTKYAANAMLANRISFMNWLSQLCEKNGADITEVRKGIGSDKRIGFPFLWAGAGFGGSCFPKDLQALRAIAKAQELDTSLVDAIISINANQKKQLSQKIKNYFENRGGLEGKTIAILGLSFKPDTDDMRQAPSLVLIEELIAAGCMVRLFDPVAMENAKKQLPEAWKASITWCRDEMHAAEKADAIALVTEWKQFRLLDVKQLLKTMSGNAFFDGRNQYNPSEMAKIGCNYISIGRAPSYGVLEHEFEWVTQETADA